MFLLVNLPHVLCQIYNFPMLHVSVAYFYVMSHVKFKKFPCCMFLLLNLLLVPSQIKKIPCCVFLLHTFASCHMSNLKLTKKHHTGLMGKKRLN